MKKIALKQKELGSTKACVIKNKGSGVKLVLQRKLQEGLQLLIN
jgi:hypothetical protein